MPTNNDDANASIEPNAADISPEHSEEEETSFAENNEIDSDGSSPKPSADEQEDDTEQLRQELKMKARNERQLGSISAKTAKFLVKRALSGDTEAIETLSDPETKQYVFRKYPEEYEKIFEGEKGVAEQAADIAYRRMEEKGTEEQLRTELSRMGVKGEEDMNRCLQAAKANYNISRNIGNSARAGYITVKGELPRTQPNIPSGNAPRTKEGGEKLDPNLVRAFGIQSAYEKYKDRI